MNWKDIEKRYSGKPKTYKDTESKLGALVNDYNCKHINDRELLDNLLLTVKECMESVVPEEIYCEDCNTRPKEILEYDDCDDRIYNRALSDIKNNISNFFKEE